MDAQYVYLALQPISARRWSAQRLMTTWTNQANSLSMSAPRATARTIASLTMSSASARLSVRRRATRSSASRCCQTRVQRSASSMSGIPRCVAGRVPAKEFWGEIRLSGNYRHTERGKPKVIRLRTRLGHVSIVAVTAGALVLANTPAEALATPILAPAAGIPTAGTYNVVPQCNPGPGVATNLNQITYLIQGDAIAYSTNGVPPVATGITCSVFDADTGAYYGSASAAMPGALAVAASPVTVPFNSNPYLCGVANALFANNATATNGTVMPC